MRGFFTLTLACSIFGFTSSSASTAANCRQYEAQFSGAVTAMKAGLIADSQGESPICEVKIRFDSFKPSMICPMFKEIAEKNWIKSSSCPQRGEAVSGVLEQLGDQNIGSIQIDE